jgi:hypothetical protein
MKFSSWNSIEFHEIPWKFHGKFHEFTERFSPGQSKNVGLGRVSVDWRINSNNTIAAVKRDGINAIGKQNSKIASTNWAPQIVLIRNKVIEANPHKNTFMHW